MPNRRVHIILSAPVFLVLYSYTAVAVLLILIMSFLRFRRGITFLMGWWAKSMFPLMGKKVRIRGRENIQNRKAFSRDQDLLKSRCSKSIKYWFWFKQ